jgi:hypothetical protein
MKLLEAVIAYKFGRLKNFVQRRKDELQLLPLLPFMSQMDLLHQMVQQIASECEEVKGLLIEPDRVEVTFFMKGQFAYSCELIYGRSVQELAEQIVDEVIFPYVMDLWANGAVCEETPCKKSAKLPA